MCIIPAILLKEIIFMKNKSVFVSLALAMLASACGDTAYTSGQQYSTAPYNNNYPNNTGYQYNNGYQYNTGYQNYNQGCYNNMAMQNCYNPSLQMNAYAQAQLNTQMMMNQYYYRQNMFSWQMRLNTPGYYNMSQAYSSCMPRPVYTTTRSCRRARSYCSGRRGRSCTDVVIVHSNTGTSDNSSNTNGNTNSNTNTNSNGNQPCQTCNTGNTNTNANNNIKVLPISWKGKDAKALFDRLAREEEVLEQGKIRRSKGLFTRTGEFYKCMVDGSKKDADSYVCDLEIRVEDGLVLRQFPAGKTGTPVVSGVVYEGDLLKIGMPGNSPESGVLTIAGPSAKYLFESMHSEESTGTVGDATGVEDSTEAKIRTAGAVKCFQTVNTRKEITQCVIKMKTDTGEVLDGKTGTVQADPAPAAEASPTPAAEASPTPAAEASPAPSPGM